MASFRLAQAFVGFALLAAAFAPASAAQDPSAPSPSPTANILYAHHHDSDTEELNGWMNTLVTDPTGNDVALGPTTTCCPEERVYTITLAPALASTLELDPTGNVVIDAYIGAGGSNGVVRVSTELTHGGEVVASGAAVNHLYQQSDAAAYPKVSWTIAPEITTLEAGKDLVWTVALTGVAVQTVFLSVSVERGSSAITLPILSGGSPAPGDGGSTGNSTTNSTTSTSLSSSSTSGSATSTSTSATTTTSTSSSSASTSGTTTNTTSGDEKDSPTPPLAFVGLAVLLAAVAVRRRLR